MPYTPAPEDKWKNIFYELDFNAKAKEDHFSFDATYDVLKEIKFHNWDPNIANIVNNM